MLVMINNSSTFESEVRSWYFWLGSLATMRLRLSCMRCIECSEARRQKRAGGRAPQACGLNRRLAAVPSQRELWGSNLEVRR